LKNGVESGQYTTSAVLLVVGAVLLLLSVIVRFTPDGELVFGIGIDTFDFSNFSHS
jgi:hypothetical protein